MVELLRRGVLFIIFVSISVLGFSQDKSYKYMMDDINYNFYEVVDSSEAYFATHGTGKGSGWKGYQRWKNENESKFYPSGNRLDAYFDGAQRSYQKQHNTAKLWIMAGKNSGLGTPTM
ncbi:MAG: hypothetical protein ACI9UJ_000133 [bacterium]|jgi:hypothetical protein